jgi:hypothetical protein
LPPLVKIVSAPGATYFIDAGKISGIVNTYVLVPEKTTDPGRLGLHSGPIKPHLLGILGFPRGIPIDRDAKDFIKSNHLESKFVTLHQASPGRGGAMDSIEPVYVKASAVSAIEILVLRGRKSPLTNLAVTKE